MVDLDFAERWRAVVRHIQDGAERLQATADALPPDLPSSAEANLRGLVARHAKALFDHTVAMNCLDALIADQLGVETG